MTTKIVELDLCCALSVATQANPIFRGKRLNCNDCGREMEYADSGTGWQYVPPTSTATTIDDYIASLITERDSLERLATDLAQQAEQRASTLARMTTERDELAALEPELVTVLGRLKQRHGCWCELPPNAGSPDHTIQCEQAQHALANAAGKGVRE